MSSRSLGRPKRSVQSASPLVVDEEPEALAGVGKRQRRARGRAEETTLARKRIPWPEEEMNNKLSYDFESQILSPLELDNLDAILKKLREGTGEIPSDIMGRANRLLEVCREELSEDGKEHEFFLGSKSVNSGLWSVFSVSYTLVWAASWHSVYHNDTERRETALIKVHRQLEYRVFDFNKSLK